MHNSSMVQKMKEDSIQSSQAKRMNSPLDWHYPFFSKGKKGFNKEFKFVGTKPLQNIISLCICLSSSLMMSMVLCNLSGFIQLSVHKLRVQKQTNKLQGITEQNVINNHGLIIYKNIHFLILPQEPTIYNCL